MTPSRTRTARLKLVAVLTTLLILVGAGGAAAYWTASTDLDGEASSAAIGVTQTDPLKLKTVYDSGHLAAADIVTVHNTGSVPAHLSVTVGGQGGSGLPATLQIAISTKNGAEGCTSSAALKDPLTGGLGLTFNGELAADESIDLCVRTTLPARAVFAHAGEQTGITVTSTLTYAEGTDWTRSSSGKIGDPVAQRVHEDPSTGAPSAKCEDVALGLSLWDQRFSIPVDPQEGSVDYRAYIVQGDRVADLPSGKLRLSERSGERRVTIAERELYAAASAQGWNAGNTWFVLEKKPSGAGDDSWATAGIGKFHFIRVLLIDEIYCGWK